jgi:uncharacterized protein YmfQ (DUF2313 family)
MANDVLVYQRAIRSLFPKGKAFNFSEDKSLNDISNSMAALFYKVDKRADDLLKELCPLDSIELLSDWERVLDLPYNPNNEELSVQERRNQVLAKLSLVGGQSRAFYISLIKSLGFTIEIQEHRPFTPGSVAGDAVSNSTEWMFVWDVIVTESAAYYFTAGSSAGESLRVFRNEVVQYFINKMKPAHTFVRFIYEGE